MNKKMQTYCLGESLKCEKCVFQSLIVFDLDSSFFCMEYRLTMRAHLA